MFDLWNVMMAGLNKIPEIEKDCTNLIDWKWTPDPKPVGNLATDLENKIRKGKIRLTPYEDPGDVADQEVRSRRGGTVLPLTPKGSLGSSYNTGHKRRITLISKKSSGSGASPKKPREPSIGGDSDDSSNNSDTDPSDNEGELPKKKLTSEQLLHKYMKV